MKIEKLTAVCLCCLAAACGQTAPPEQSAPAPQAIESLPPSFLDEPPPGPVSATTVFSGGTLVTDAVTGDAVVVVRNGQLLGWGPRGAVDMPNDSVGVDMRGKWIVPGRQADLENRNLPNLAAWQPGQPANLLFLTTDPTQSAASADAFAGEVVDGEIRLIEEP